MLCRALPLFALGAALSSCSGDGADSGPEPVSADEERALSQAAEMLEERPRETDEANAEGEPPS